MNETSANDSRSSGSSVFAVPPMYKQHCGRRIVMRYRAQSVFNSLGIYSGYRRLELARVRRLIFVCQGNICRSPFAEVVAQELGFEARSVGLLASGNSQANAMAERVAQEMGYSMRDHVSRHATSEKVTADDLVICMQTSQAKATEKIYQRSSPQTTLLGLFAQSPHPWVLDPYGMPDEFFRFCFELIEDAVIRLVRQIDPLLAIEKS